MVRFTKVVDVDRAEAKNYKFVADNFYAGAEVASEYEYWNAAGVLIVHAAIALGDTITIKFGGRKSKGEDHSQLVSLIKSIVPKTSERDKALLQLEKIIAHKTSVSYSGELYGHKDIAHLWKHLNRFKPWVEQIVETN